MSDPAPIRMWICPYCRDRVEVEDSFHTPVDHMLENHLAELVAERPLILHR
jgi:hypothetical protein